MIWTKFLLAVNPEFIKELEQAGINEVVADKQAQFDAWLAESSE